MTQAKNAAHIESYELQATLLGPDGKEVQRRAIGVPGHVETGRETLLRMRVNAPAHWTAETPRLYAIRVDLLVAGAVVHSRAVTVGFRHVSAANGVLRINGQPVKLRGVDRHDEHPDVGRATRPRDWLEDIRLMKAANINFVRTSHYPPAEGFIRLCDEMGLYVLDEIPMGYGGDLAADPSLAGGALLRAQETLSRDRNHPSVIIWSIGNEDPLTVTHLAVIRLVNHGAAVAAGAFGVSAAPVAAATDEAERAPLGGATAGPFDAARCAAQTTVRHAQARYRFSFAPTSLTFGDDGDAAARTDRT